VFDAQTVSGPATHAICWQRQDESGMEWCQVAPAASLDGRRIEGVAVVVLDRVPWRADYVIELDASGRTRRALVVARNGQESRSKSVALEADGRGQWRNNGQLMITDDQCLDVDLGFSPMTNSLPIWRLGLGVGERRDIHVAWVLFPSLDVIVGEQSYERFDERRWRYRSEGFAADLQVGADGLVDDYVGYWRAIARG
jgi:uncharacterized protein